MSRKSLTRATAWTACLWTGAAWAQPEPPPTDLGEPAAVTADPEAAPAAAADDSEVIVIVGTATGKNRTVVDSPVAVDVIDAAELASRYGQIDLNQTLQLVAPSFNATRQSGSDGADHIDPATLRGLGPDQTLVLINGKRRHQSSLINIFGSRGRGNTGTDLNAIPMAAIERIEILRDGASALYGSDAIAGVINIVLKSDVSVLDASVLGGARNATPPSDVDVKSDGTFDGEVIRAAANYGIGLGDDGFINLTADYTHRGRTNRPADPAKFDIYRKQYGDAAVDSIGTMVNAEYNLGESTVYVFGGYSLRLTDAFAWTREPDSERNVPAIYPNGFDPHITSKIDDISVSGGWRHDFGGWRVDINNTFGLNRFHYNIEGTLNASLGERSPTEFDAGGHSLSQNTTSASVTHSFVTEVFEAINVGAGAEVRTENFSIFAGEEGSYRNYCIDNPDCTRDDGSVPPGGSQGFPGFQPANELDESRLNLAAYVDGEIDFTSYFLLGLTGRYENYSDFGNTVNGKVATRLELADLLGLDIDNLALRASASTGFRAPSLAQVYYNNTFTDFVGGVAIDKLIAANDSELAKALGIPALTEEKSLTASAGFSLKAGPFVATADGYVIDIKDRIVLTGAFDTDDPDIGAELTARDVGAAQFFTNALDTRTWGLDVVGTWAPRFGEHQPRVSLAGNFNKMELGDIHAPKRLAGKEETFFGRREQKFLLASAPPSKITLGLGYSWRMLSADVRLIRWDEVVLIDWLDTEDVYDAAITVDASIAAHLTDWLTLTIGAENALNVYPTQQDTETETGGLWDAVQMGSAGAFYFTRLGLKI
ncbi:MAG: TonB-dependent receptor [Myxococcales bacterium]|nr:TonB-dependent receptor [Myxococcales bacterium]